MREEACQWWNLRDAAVRDRKSGNLCYITTDRSSISVPSVWTDALVRTKESLVWRAHHSSKISFVQWLKPFQLSQRTLLGESYTALDDSIYRRYDIWLIGCKKWVSSKKSRICRSDHWRILFGNFLELNCLKGMERLQPIKTTWSFWKGTRSKRGVKLGFLI